MKTHSRILLQNCVLDILMLTVQLFVEGFHLFDNEVNTYIFPNGILLSFFIKENFDPFIAYIFLVFWEYILNLNLFGLCVQFIYRYLVLNRYMYKMLYILNRAPESLYNKNSRELSTLLERRPKFLPFPVPEAKILRILEGQEARFLPFWKYNNKSKKIQFLGVQV
ncbi:unnamed protein product [Meloidogyne enterolobii]|uniref:Uncharacterized protein n=4 Tax=Meloidogyne enterolobii TaxID=390850 RepID=A0ACB0YZP0_MELEN|nr:unnamed protein product [Meloidogyne enterolobii]